MDHFKRLIGGFLAKNDFEKVIIKIKVSHKTTNLKEQYMIDLKHGIEGKGKNQSSKECIEMLIEQFYTADQWIHALKLCLVYHRFIFNMNKPTFALEFSKSKCAQEIPLFAKHAKDKDEMIQIPLVYHFFKYLKEESKFHDFIVLSQRFFENQNLERALEELGTRVFDILSEKMHITINFLKDSHKIFEILLAKFVNVDLNRSAFQIILGDIIVQYELCQQITSHYLQTIFNEDDAKALHIYELYELLINFGKRLEKFYQLKNLIEDFTILKPNYFTVDKDNNKKIELYIQSISRHPHQTQSFESPKMPVRIQELQTQVVQPKGQNENDKSHLKTDLQSDDEDDHVGSKSNLLIQNRNEPGNFNFINEDYFKFRQEEQLTINNNNDNYSRRSSHYSQSQINIMFEGML